jgi:hypothetical protein
MYTHNLSLSLWLSGSLSLSLSLSLSHTHTHTHTQARNSFVMTIMPLDKLPFKTDATLYRSLGAFLNHAEADKANTIPEHIVAKGAPMVSNSEKS